MIRSMAGAWILMAAVSLGEFVEVIPEEVLEDSTFWLDADGDGEAEFYGCLLDRSHGDMVSFGIEVNYGPGGMLGGEIFAGSGGAVFDSPEALVGSPFFEPHFAQADTIDIGPFTIPGYYAVTPQSPLGTFWCWGTAIDEVDGACLLGWVIDASAFYGSDGAEPVKLYWKNFGRFSAGGEVRLSLEATGFPVGRRPLDVEFSFPAPKCVRFTVGSKLGMSYRILRSSDAGAGGTEVMRSEGTGGELTLEFDDSGDEGTRAFFTLEEFAPESPVSPRVIPTP